MKYLYLLSISIMFLYSCMNHAEKKKKADNLFYDKAFEFREKNMPDSAFFYFIKAKDLFLQQKDTLNAGKCLINMAIFLAGKGDYYGAQEFSLNAISYFDQKKKDQYAYINSNYNNLGIVTAQLGNYEEALKFYNNAIKFSTDSSHISLYLNNKATIYQKVGDYNAALKIYDHILKDVNINSKTYAKALTNISATKWLQNPNYNALPDYLKALHIREREKDLLGLNSSFSHLSDFYARKTKDSAFFYAQKMYQVATQLNSVDDRLSALRRLIQVSPPKATQQYFAAYQSLGDSVQTTRNMSTNRFALIRFETEKIKADFLKVQSENIQKQNNILRKNFALGILFLLLLAGYWWYRKRKKGLEQEKVIEVKNTEIKYVKKIHDRVANKVYQLMSEVENIPEVDRDTLLDKLESLYNISRDISYDSKELNMGKNYDQELAKMLKSYSGETRQIFIIGNEQELWEGVNPEAKAEVFYIMQELMTNMKKHSQAETVVLKFNRNEMDINISYSDDGIGMKDAIQKNGLTNTENRIKSIRGTITFDNRQEKELEIQLSFPFS
ncbi:tetratricopeptide repeat-containing sensor histidine kinase [Pedobacter cryoconitis]|uniref:tetratricopeptide repeat-containing sensor histidine kinase n=1 Tax=Pedobacter cryoconitis TaxID=188932 RepID=UPI0018DD11A4|nr:tetratricopeptide repeat-containing sensor histidine kinase [Pedobacter cryoconitis]